MSIWFAMVVGALLLWAVLSAMLLAGAALREKQLQAEVRALELGEHRVQQDLECLRGSLREKENSQAVLERQLREEREYRALRDEQLRELQIKATRLEYAAEAQARQAGA